VMVTVLVLVVLVVGMAISTWSRRLGRCHWRVTKRLLHDGYRSAEPHTARGPTCGIMPPINVRAQDRRLRVRQHAGSLVGRWDERWRRSLHRATPAGRQRVSTIFSSTETNIYFFHFISSLCFWVRGHQVYCCRDIARGARSTSMRGMRCRGGARHTRLGATER